mgnify:CR=1 FL=1
MINMAKKAMFAGSEGRYLYTVHSIEQMASVQFASGPKGMAGGCAIVGSDCGGTVSDMLNLCIRET